MDTGLFDVLARTVARRRRGSTPAPSEGTVTAGTPAGRATPAADLSDPSFLFVQTASSGTFEANPAAGTPAPEGQQVPGGDADFLLTLYGHTGATVYFSDRPERIFGEAPTQQFLDGLGFPADNPPNAAIVTHDEDGTEDVLVVELSSPFYDSTFGALTYGVRILGDYEGDGLASVLPAQQDDTLPARFGAASLFIDDCPDMTMACIIPRSFSGNPDTCFASGSNITVGTCWSWSNVWCEPCQGVDDNYNDACNSAYAGCVGECVAASNESC